ncbi:MAG: HAD family phosphatase [Cytophagales bacterium]|jgi:epoxide hydrolase-like predicted phosphatase|nr:HAD family phosphatase [Cytophagales bacterium]MCA6386792.1 HAD family phosphatase [Cytophagales bacterium]MCA6391659.1 HAD family phosphatase [Cytophagales bacterium]MCA6394012.1 HAD family phosphatase [Cytophagales bacterium]MCA6399266.1 HAD family phosphatase [Cytophagales bacterium]
MQERQTPPIAIGAEGSLDRSQQGPLLNSFSKGALVPANSSFKNVIFDLGGVILGLDVNQTYRQFAKLSGKTVDHLKAKAANVTFFEDFERGRISDTAFRDQLRLFLEIDLSDEQIDNGWNAMLLDLSVARLDLLKKIGLKFRIFLLSNTNNIHLQAFNGIVRTAIGDQLFGNYFEKDYYSHFLGMRKPDREIFQYVLHQNGLKAEETLFLDDSVLNLQGAATLGIQTLHIQHPDQLFSLFNEA